jgi:hypothetical protein
MPETIRLMRLYHVEARGLTGDSYPMRRSRLLIALAATLLSATGLVVCLGPCCPVPSSAGGLSIEEIPCCGADGTSECQPSLQRADGLGAISTTTPATNLVLVDVRDSVPLPSAPPSSAVSKTPAAPLRAPVFRDTPLLI